MKDITKEFKKGGDVYNFIIKAVTADPNVEVTSKLAAEPRILSMQLNGIEIDPSHTIKHMYDTYRENVNKRAKALAREYVQDRVDGILEKFDDLVDQLCEEIDMKEVNGELS